MKYSEFMGALQKGSLKHVYLLSGEEPYYIDRAKARILELLFPGEGEAAESLLRMEGDVDLDELSGNLGSVSLFSDRTVVLLEHTNLFREKKTAGDEKAEKGRKDKKLERFLDFLQHMPETGYLIFVTGEKADKRRKLYKTVEKAGAVLEAEAVRAWNINEWLQGKLQSLNREMDRDAYTYFNGVVSMMQQISLGYLDREFDKLALYSDNRKITKKELREVLSGLPEVSLFALMDAVSEKDIRKAMLLLGQQLRSGTYVPLLLGLLVRHVRQLWQAKLLMAQGYQGKALGQPMELNPFIAERLGRASKQFTEEVLERAFLELADADYMIKTGQAGPERLEHAVILLCRRAG